MKPYKNVEILILHQKFKGSQTSDGEEKKLDKKHWCDMMNIYKYLSPRVSFFSRTGGGLLDLNAWPALIISSPSTLVGGFAPTNFRKNTCCPVLKILFVNLIQNKNHDVIKILFVGEIGLHCGRITLSPKYVLTIGNHSSACDKPNNIDNHNCITCQHLLPSRYKNVNRLTSVEYRRVHKNGYQLLMHSRSFLVKI